MIVDLFFYSFLLSCLFNMSVTNLKKGIRSQVTPLRAVTFLVQLLGCDCNIYTVIALVHIIISIIV